MRTDNVRICRGLLACKNQDYWVGQVWRERMRTTRHFEICVHIFFFQIRTLFPFLLRPNLHCLNFAPPPSLLPSHKAPIFPPPPLLPAPKVTGINIQLCRQEPNPAAGLAGPGGRRWRQRATSYHRPPRPNPLPFAPGPAAGVVVVVEKCGSGDCVQSKRANQADNTLPFGQFEIRRK